jgi:hypothetical protein
MTVAFMEIPALSFATISPACFSWYHPTAALRKRIPIMTPKSEGERWRDRQFWVAGRRGEEENEPIQSAGGKGKNVSLRIWVEGGKGEEGKRKARREGKGKKERERDEGKNIPWRPAERMTAISMM